MNNQNLPPVLSIEQASTYLQLDVDELRRELEQNNIPGRQIAKKWRISREALDRWLDSINTTLASNSPILSSETVADVDHNTDEGKIPLSPRTSLSAESESTVLPYTTPTVTNTINVIPEDAAVVLDELPQSEVQPTDQAPSFPLQKRMRARVFMYNPEGKYWTRSFAR